MQVLEEDIYLEKKIEVVSRYPEIIGESSVLKKALDLITKVASTDCTVLIMGETGTGKELVARAIHNNSTRKGKAMIKVNCASLPAELIESELFGHERGSFTGAHERRIGKFELANESTLFLDEIGEIPIELQAKLLRALQDREIDRIGGKTTLKIDVRIIAATNRDLEKEVEEGRFRTDLYYRLNIFPINMPSLRDRREDILPLANYFIQKISEKSGKRITMVSERALQALVHYDWPGNIRELEHVIERSILLSDDRTIRQFCLPARRIKLITRLNEDSFSIKTLDENERDHIVTTLRYCKGRISGINGAAEFLGVPASTLQSKIRRLGIKKMQF